jgi:hypothetical protein
MSTTLSTGQRAVVRREVEAMLGESAAFSRLPAGERSRILDATASVASALVAEGRGPAPAALPVRRRPVDPYALAQETPPPFGPGSFPGDPTAPPAAPPTDEKWRPDERFRAEGIAQGVTQVGRVVNEVNFPAFVSSLVRGTFNAVVDASIQQMKAYGELVQSVAMSLNEFRDQHVEVAEGQRHLASKYPDIFQFMKPSDADKPPTLTLREDWDGEEMPNFQGDLGLDAPIDDLEDEGAVDRLVVAARTELARGRQQLLATTILMGINRIIVTDGKINAKVKFNFTATDHMDRTGVVADYDKQTEVREFDFSTADQLAKGRWERPVNVMVSTTTGTSTADLAATAQLSGDVSLNFKSETFPLERMMNSEQMFRLNQAWSGGRGVPAQPVAAAPGAPAPLPTAPAPAAPPAAPPPTGTR